MELRKKKNVKEGYELLVDHIVKVNGLFLSLVAFPTVELLMRMEIFGQACLRDSNFLVIQQNMFWSLFSYNTLKNSLTPKSRNLLMLSLTWWEESIQQDYVSIRKRLTILTSSRYETRERKRPTQFTKRSLFTPLLA